MIHLIWLIKRWQFNCRFTLFIVITTNHKNRSKNNNILINNRFINWKFIRSSLIQWLLPLAHRTCLHRTSSGKRTVNSVKHSYTCMTHIILSRVHVRCVHSWRLCVCMCVCVCLSQVTSLNSLSFTMVIFEKDKRYKNQATSVK